MHVFLKNTIETYHAVVKCIVHFNTPFLNLCSVLSSTSMTTEGNKYEKHWARDSEAFMAINIEFTVFGVVTSGNIVVGYP